MKNIKTDIPEQVIKTAFYLKQTKDARFQTMQALISPREMPEDWDTDKDHPDEKSYAHMWNTIKKYEEKTSARSSTNEWVLSFLDDVIAAKNLPQYICLDNTDRLVLISKIGALADELIKIFIENSMISSICMREALCRKEYKKSKKMRNKILSDRTSGTEMAQILSSHVQSLIFDIGSAEFITKDSVGVEERMFAFSLVKRNKSLYNKPLHQAVATAIWAIYGRNNSSSTIANIIRRAQEL